MKTEETNLTHSFPNDEALAAIGKITLSHAWLDYALRMTVMDLAGVTKNEALDGTARQGSRELRERVRRLGKTRLGEGPALVKLDALVHRAERATEQRNHLLHSVWARNLDRDGDFLREPDHSFRPAPTAKELENLTAEILDVVYSVINARLDAFLKAALKKKTLREA